MIHKERSLKSLLVTLLQQKETIDEKYKLISYLKSKLYEIHLIEQIHYDKLREDFLKNINKKDLLFEIQDIESDIEQLIKYFFTYIDYNMTDCLFKCSHPLVDGLVFSCFLCKYNCLVKESDHPPIFRIYQNTNFCKDTEDYEYIKDLSNTLCNFIKKNRGL
jgi:hypothetical protein